MTFYWTPGKDATMNPILGAVLVKDGVRHFAMRKELISGPALHVIRVHDAITTDFATLPDNSRKTVEDLLEKLGY